MVRGDYEAVPDADGIYYHDTGMYDVDGYGSVYVIDAEEPAVVDTGIGTNVDLLFETLEELSVEPAYILPTHIHLDHAGGAGFLAERYPDATVMTHERGVPHLVAPERLVEGTKAAVEEQWRHYVDPEPVPEDRIEGLSDGDEIGLGDRTLDVREAPGHAPHQVTFRDTADDVLFAGDAAGIYVPEKGTVRETSPPSQFDLEQCLEDASAIEGLSPRTLCFGHFGPRPFDDEVMGEYKRALVEWVEAVRQKREELDDDDAVVDYFGDNTEMVEVWGEEKARAEARMNTRGVLGYLDYIESA